MSEVIDPGKKSDEEEEEDEEQEFSEFHDGRLVDLPVHHDLHDQGSKDSVESTWSTNLEAIDVKIQQVPAKTWGIMCARLLNARFLISNFARRIQTKSNSA